MTTPGLAASEGRAAQLVRWFETRRGRRTLAVLVAGVVAVRVTVMIWRLAAEGAHVEGDGHDYLARAEDMRAGRWLTPNSLSGPTHYPPIYPGAVALISDVSGLRLTSAAILVNTASWILFLVGIHRLVCVVSGGQARTVWVALAVGFASASAQLLSLNTAMASELLFMAAATWFVVVLLRFVETQDRRVLAVAALLGAASIATRYVGLALVAGGCLWLLTGLGPRGRRVVSSTVLGLGAIAPVVAWYLWVSARADSGVPHTAGGISGLGWVESPFWSLVSLGSWFVGVDSRDRPPGFNAPDAAQPVLAAIAFVVCVGLALIVVRVVMSLPRGPSLRRSGALGNSGAGIVLALVVYGLLIFVWRVRAGEYILARYWTIVPFVAVCVLSLASSSSREGPRAARLPPHVEGWLLLAGAGSIALNLAAAVLGAGAA
jgi:hypothetical protein